MEIVTIIISVISALASGAAVFYSYKSANIQNTTFKKGKVAEFRQEWINSLRDAMASFQSYAITPDLNHSKDREFYMYGCKILLYLNPKDENYEQIRELIGKFVNAKTTDEKWERSIKFSEICQKIIKNEWEVTKKTLD